MTQPVITIGYPVPDDFPAAPYNLIHTTMQRRATESLFWEYGSAWNAVAYRFTQTADHDDAYRRTLAGSGDVNMIRYQQEKELFCFFTAGLSVLEAFFYAMHSAAAIVDPAGFPMATESDLRHVDIRLTTVRFAGRFPIESLTQAMTSIVDDPSLNRWERVRNVLVHRQAPGRVVFGSTVREAPPDEWKLEGLSLDANLTSSRRRWLSQGLASLMACGLEFVERHTGL